MPKLTKEEKQIEQDLETGRFVSMGPEAVTKYTQLARKDLVTRKAELKVERINIRLTRGQLEQLKARAEQEGLPYQSLVASVLHKYLNGSLVEVKSLASVKHILKLV